MHLKTAVLVVAFAACDAFATPISRSPYAVKETHFAPAGWTKQERSHGGKTIQLQIGLKQGHFDELHRHLQEGMAFGIIHQSKIWQVLIVGSV